MYFCTRPTTSTWTTIIVALLYLSVIRGRDSFCVWFVSSSSIFLILSITYLSHVQCSTSIDWSNFLLLVLSSSLFYDEPILNSSFYRFVRWINGFTCCIGNIEGDDCQWKRVHTLCVCTHKTGLMLEKEIGNREKKQGSNLWLDLFRSSKIGHHAHRQYSHIGKMEWMHTRHSKESRFVLYRLRFEKKIERNTKYY